MLINWFDTVGLIRANIKEEGKVKKVIVDFRIGSKPPVQVEVPLLV